jgi:hypothetical protein
MYILYSTKNPGILCSAKRDEKNFHYSSQFKYSSFYLKMIQDPWWQRRGGGGGCSSQSIQSARLSVKSESGPPTPSPQANVGTPFGSGGGHTRLRGRGWEDPIPTMGQTLWYSMYTILPLWCSFSPLRSRY